MPTPRRIACESVAVVILWLVILYCYFGILIQEGKMPRRDSRKSNVIPGTVIPIVGQRKIIDKLFDDWWDDQHKKNRFTKEMKPALKTAFMDGIANAENMVGKMLIHDRPLTHMLDQVVPKGEG